MLRSDKERVVAQLARRLRDTDTLIVADYRGLSMPEIDELRSRLLEAGARFTVVKNTLTKLAAEEAGTKDVLELIDRVDQPSLGAGEPAMCPVAAAIGNAVYNATGVWLRDVPFTPERVLDAMRRG